jgi:alpha-beta hydrolase superfamily lysophospholipase
VQRHVVRRTESHFRAPDGRALFRRAWLPADAQRALILVHGLADHSGRYDHLGAWLATRQYAVHGFDLRGHGRSEGARCHVARFDELVSDLEAFLALVRGEHPEQRLFLLGHSLGGLVVATLLCERCVEVEGAVVSAVALELGLVPSSAQLRAMRLLRLVRPHTSLATRIDANALCRDPEVVRDYLEDPLVPRHMSVAMALEFLRAAQRTARRGAELKVPLLLLHGDMDSLCLPRGARTFYNQLRVPGRRLLVYPKLRHELFNEPEQEQVCEDVNAWILERES